MGDTIFVAVFASVVSAIFSGAGGFWLATTRANTRLTALETKTESCLESLSNNATETNHRLSIILRMMIDLARKTPGFEFRTADLFELTSLEPSAFSRAQPPHSHARTDE